MHHDAAETFRRSFEADERNDAENAREGIWLVQLLCSARHAILCVAFDAATDKALDVMGDAAVAVAAEIRAGRLDPGCGLCGSRVWHFEVGKSKFKTLDEAKPELARVEQANLATRAFLKRSRGDTTDG